MQTPSITLSLWTWLIATKLNALKIFLEEQRSNIVDNAVQQALAKCEELDIPMENQKEREECQARRQEMLDCRCSRRLRELCWSVLTVSISSWIPEERQ